MRRQRYFPAHCVYEITLRVSRGLPFAPKQTIEVILKSAIARTQRDSKAVLSHFVWMGNHVHILVISKDADQLRAFYGEIQKRVTDSLKRLLGREELSLWEGEPSVIRILDSEAAKNRIAYFYANPARAHLVDSIEEYPGLSSYQAFRSALPFAEASSSEEVPWIRYPTIPELPTNELSEHQDLKIVAMLKGASKHKETLVIYPNAWVACFGISNPATIAEAHQDIMERVRGHEKEAREERARRDMPPMGRKRLMAMPLMLSHIPKKYSRRIFVISTCNDLRMAYIRHVDAICALFRECFERWKQGEYYVTWPPGTFPPSFPMAANALEPA